MSEPDRTTLVALSPEQAGPLALLTVQSVRMLEGMADIGPGGCGPALISINLRQHEAALRTLAEAGYRVMRDLNINPDPHACTYCGTELEHDGCPSCNADDAHATASGEVSTP